MNQNDKTLETNMEQSPSNIVIKEKQNVLQRTFCMLLLIKDTQTTCTCICTNTQNVYMFTSIYIFNRLCVSMCICVCISNKIQNKLVILVLFFIKEEFLGLNKNATPFIVYIFWYVLNFLMLVSSKYTKINL